MFVLVRSHGAYWNTMIFLIVLLSTLERIDCQVNWLFSLRNDLHDHVRQLLHQNCSIISRSSRLFLCTNEIYSHVEFQLEVFLVPYQSNRNTCGMILKFYQIFPHNQSISSRSILSINVKRSKRFVMIIDFDYSP